MAKALSEDLRGWVIAAVEAGMSRRAAAGGVIAASLAKPHAVCTGLRFA